MHETHEAAKRLGSSIKAAIEDSGLSITSLHKRTGISRETIYRIQRGETLPSLEILLRIADELGVSAGALIDGHIMKKGVESDARKVSETKKVATKLADLQERVERLERRKRAH